MHMKKQEQTKIIEVEVQTGYPCPHCRNGRQSVESGSSLGYPCEDCYGTGRKHIIEEIEVDKDYQEGESY